MDSAYQFSKKINVLAAKMLCKNGKEGELTPVLMVTASPDCSGGGVDGGSLGLWHISKISTGPWIMSSNLIKNINLLAVKVV